jgi:hypothetical protein
VHIQYIGAAAANLISSHRCFLRRPEAGPESLRVDGLHELRRILAKSGHILNRDKRFNTPVEQFGYAMLTVGYEELFRQIAG